MPVNDFGGRFRSALESEEIGELRRNSPLGIPCLACHFNGGWQGEPQVDEFESLSKLGPVNGGAIHGLATRKARCSI